MTLLAMQGFDDSISEVGLTNSLTLNNANSRTGVGGSGTTAAVGAACTIPHTPSATMFYGFGFNRGTQSGNGGNALWWAAEGAVVHVSLRMNASNQLVLYRGDGTTVLATSTWTLNPSTWCYIEVKVTVHDTTGVVEVKVDGVVVLTYSGDTRNAGAVGTIDSTRLGYITTGTNGTTYFDDFYAASDAGAAPYNAYLGDVVVRTLLPTGNGDSSAFVGSDGNSVDNYLLVDEANSSMTDYVGASVSGATDLYQMADVPATYAVLAVQELIYALKSDGGTGPTMLPVAKGQAGTVRADAALAPLSTTAQSLAAEIRTTDPDGNALTAARLNAMQVGVRIQ